MTYKTFFHYLFLVSAGILLTAETSEFVKKKKKTASTTTLKEECCNYTVGTLHQSSGALSRIAYIQTEAMNIISDMLEDNFFTHAKKSDIESSRDEFDQFYERQKTINKLLEEQITFLQEQKNKQAKKA